MKKLTAITAIATLSATFAAGCTSDSTGNDTADSVAIGQFEERYPFDTLSEAHAFSHHWVTVTVNGESFEADGVEKAYFARTVDLSVVDQHWSSPLVLDRVPEAFSIENGSQVVQDGERKNLVFNDTTRMEVGGSYLVALVSDPGGPQLPSIGAVYPVIDGEIAYEGEADNPGTIVDDIAGTSPDDAVSIILDAAPIVPLIDSDLDRRLAIFNNE